MKLDKVENTNFSGLENDDERPKDENPSLVNAIKEEKTPSKSDLKQNSLNDEQNAINAEIKEKKKINLPKMEMEMLTKFEINEQEINQSLGRLSRKIKSDMAPTHLKILNNKMKVSDKQKDFFAIKKQPLDPSIDQTKQKVFKKSTKHKSESLSNSNDDSNFKMKLFYIDSNNERKSRIVTNPELRKVDVRKADIPNPYSIEDKKRFFELHREKERLDYVADYEAINIQKKNEKEFDKKTHITKMKGAHGQISLKRSFGVSYIKKLECFQKNVEHIYKPLPNLVIQDSKQCRILKSLIYGFGESIDRDFFQNDSHYNLGFLMKSPNEVTFRKYLCSTNAQTNPEFLPKHFYFQNLRDLTYFFDHELFLCIFLNCNFLQVDPMLRDKSTMQRAISSHAPIIKEKVSDEQNKIDKLITKTLCENKLKMTFYSKKSLNSKKCFLKSVPYELPQHIQNVFFRKKRRLKKKSSEDEASNLEDVPLFTPEIIKYKLENTNQREKFEGKKQLNEYVELITNMEIGNFNTMSIKMEAFVEEDFWKKLELSEKNIIFTYVCAFKLKLEEFIFYEGLKWFYLKKNQNDLYERENILVQFANEYEKIKDKIREKNINKKYQDLLNKAFDIFVLYKDFAEINTLPKSDSLKNLENIKKFNLLNPQNLEKLTKKNEERVNENNKSNIEDFHKLLKRIINLNPCVSEEIIPKFTKKLNNTKPVIPNYLVNTRDCFMFDLKKQSKEINCNGRKVIENRFFFKENDTPSNFSNFKQKWPDRDTGVVTYENFFTEEELQEIESFVDGLEDEYYRGSFLANTGQPSLGAKNIKRTKFFFGARYIWHAQQLIDSHSNVAGGVRRDTSEIPFWMHKKVLNPLVDGTLIPKDFINSTALNIYHDGEEGLAQHFDDAVRFKQPIFTLRVFSDARLSFGSQLYSFCNGAFCIDLPRGAVCVMLENGYAANGIKHCIRPVDMTGKSAAFIMRQMHKEAVKIAEKYDWLVDFPLAFQTLSLNENAVEYWRQQKVLEKKGDAVSKKRGPKKKVKQSNQSAETKNILRNQSKRKINTSTILKELSSKMKTEKQKREEKDYYNFPTVKPKKKAIDVQINESRKMNHLSKKQKDKTRFRTKKIKKSKKPKILVDESKAFTTFPTFMDTEEKKLSQRIEHLNNYYADDNNKETLKNNLMRLKRIEMEVIAQRRQLKKRKKYLNHLYQKEIQLKLKKLDKRPTFFQLQQVDYPSENDQDFIK